MTSMRGPHLEWTQLAVCCRRSDPTAFADALGAIFAGLQPMGGRTFDNATAFAEWVPPRQLCLATGCSSH